MSEFAVSSQKRSGRNLLLRDLEEDVLRLLANSSSSSSTGGVEADDKGGSTEAFRASVRQHLRTFPSQYAAAVTAEEVVFHMKLLSRINHDRHHDQTVSQQYVVSCGPASSGDADSTSDASAKILIICRDVPKIFNHIIAVLEQLTLSTVSASIISTSTGLAFDEFVCEVCPRYINQYDKLEVDTLRLLLSKPIQSFCVEEKSMSISNTRQVIMTKEDDISYELSVVKNGNTFLKLETADVQISAKIGTGHICETFQGVLLKYSKAQVAIKKPIQGNSIDKTKYTQLWQHEIKLMEIIGDHSNICKFIGSSKSFDSFESMFLCYEYLPGGCLADIIADTTKRIKPISIAFGIAKGMRHLHQLDIMHRDLKPANVILDHDGSAKIADFGLSRQVFTGCEMTAETGTYRWMAPEVIRHEHYGLSADVYSFAILFWELFTRIRPFDNLSPFQAAFQVAKDHLRPPIPSELSTPEKTLLRRLWHHDPYLRPTFNDICNVLGELLKNKEPS